PFQRTLAAPAGGLVRSLRLGGSPLGSALVAWVQAPPGREAGAQIAAASIQVAPGRFTVLTPPGWTRARRVPLSWDAAPSTSMPVTYDLQVDGTDVATGLRGLRRTLASRAIGDGSHRITVVATDADGQTRTSVVSRLKVDRTAPRVRVRRLRDGRVWLRVLDAPGAGVVVASVRIAWGDGTRARGVRAAVHRYAGAGPHRVEVLARDRAGNRARRTVTVR
ncbi:MAG TPA: hypothetical protein VFS37_02810, partial [Conexibacter sp.]|nr:hypothetical protein [Conexibacter sp.]